MPAIKFPNAFEFEDVPAIPLIKLANVIDPVEIVGGLLTPLAP